jgi:hypothetical protein
MLHEAVAGRFGLGASDIKCLDLARDEPDLTGRHEAALGAVFAEVAAGFGATSARYSDEQLQAYIAIQSEFNRTALDLTRSITGRPART